MNSPSSSAGTPCSSAVLAAIGLVAVSPIAIQVLFGGDFYPEAFLLLVLLMPGIIAASCTRVLGSFLQSGPHHLQHVRHVHRAWRDHWPRSRADTAVRGGGRRRGLLDRLCLRALVATLYWYGKVSGCSIAEALIWRPSDVTHYRRLVDRLRGKPASDDSRPGAV